MKKNNKISNAKINKEDAIREMINVLVQALIDIKNICVKTLNNILELNKSLN